MFTMLPGAEKMRGGSLQLKCIKRPYLYLRTEIGIIPIAFSRQKNQW